MIAIITGDIINSEKNIPQEWMPVLKGYFSKLGHGPKDWEIYRGDEFQIKTKPEKALAIAISIKALVKSLKGLDVRMSIGFGNETYVGNSVSESNGTAYQRSGRFFDKLKKEKLNLIVATGIEELDKELNFVLRLALDFMDNWSPVSAEIVAMVLNNPSISQTEMATILHIQQSAISQRQKRARLDLVLELLDYYNTLIKKVPNDTTVY
ncbi:hypothetical protein GGR42_002483 [Saonia flava]|uniref:SatD family (SatD) n=1 Tax=Saonia flava TaxID=523696 RepID=A0A846QZC0_9FLAO|nr:SatD family protein [Saonia flava]NJB71992.1 hypothetical protein [Saonia flava]